MSLFNTFNSITLMGNLTKDVEVKEVGETKIAKFTVAVNNRVKNKQSGEWEDAAMFVNCVAFGNIVDTLVKHTSKGRCVLVRGSLKIDNYKKDGDWKTYVEVVCNEVKIISKPQDGDGAEPSGESVSYATSLPGGDDTPF